MGPDKTLREKIVDQLRCAIVQGKYAPGLRLQEIEIAEQYKTSRTPVREAFRVLESEGLVEVRPRRGAIVSNASNGDIEDLDEIKSVLELYAAQKAVSIISDDEINRLEGLSSKEFNESIIKACKNNKLVSLLASIGKQVERHYSDLASAQSIDEIIEWQKQVISAFRTRDETQVKNLIIHRSKKGHLGVTNLRYL